MAYENSENPGAPAEDDAVLVDQFVVYENLVIFDGDAIGGWFHSEADALKWAVDFINDSGGTQHDALTAEEALEWVLDHDRVQFADIAIRRVLHD